MAAQQAQLVLVPLAWPFSPHLVNSAVQVALILIIAESLELVYGHIMATNSSPDFQVCYFW